MGAQTQLAFAGALLDRRAGVPRGVTSHTRARPPMRFGVYRNNVASALIEALGVRYPVVHRLVGDQFFRAMARDYALANLPRSPVLIGYGAAFPAFVDGFAPARELTYLGDVARLEAAHWEAYHAADATPLDPQALSGLAPATLAGVRLAVHPAARVVTSPFPIVSIWRTNTHDDTVVPVAMTTGEDALVTRPCLAVEVRRLPPGAACFLRALAGGATLAAAAEEAAAAEPRFDLAANLAGLLQAGFAAGIFAAEDAR